VTVFDAISRRHELCGCHTREPLASAGPLEVEGPLPGGGSVRPPHDTNALGSEIRPQVVRSVGRLPRRFDVGEDGAVLPGDVVLGAPDAILNCGQPAARNVGGAAVGCCWRGRVRCGTNTGAAYLPNDRRRSRDESAKQHDRGEGVPIHASLRRPSAWP
jgi:hypothetical protein